MLICALRNGASSNFHVDSFSSTAGEPAVINSLFGQDTLLVPQLIKNWEENDFRPVFLDLTQSDMTVNSPLGRELSRMGVTEVFAHGTYDTFGWPVSFFIFGCPAGSIAPRTSPGGTARALAARRLGPYPVHAPGTALATGGTPAAATC